jgi:hypothetical protein
MALLKSLRRLEEEAYARCGHRLDAIEEVYRRALSYYENVFPDDPSRFRDDLLGLREERLANYFGHNE